MKKIGVKERIIATASHLFYNEGYNQTGINQIIQEAEVAKASMYQYFRSKEDIAVEYLFRRHSMWMTSLSDFVANQSGVDKVAACFDYLKDWLEEVGYRGCGFQNIITDLPRDHTKIKDQVKLHKDELRNWIHSILLKETTFDKTEAMALGDQVLVLIEGAIMLSQIQKDSFPIHTAKDACVRLLK